MTLLAMSLLLIVSRVQSILWGLVENVKRPRLPRLWAVIRQPGSAEVVFY